MLIVRIPLLLIVTFLLAACNPPDVEGLYFINVGESLSQCSDGMALPMDSYSDEFVIEQYSVNGFSGIYAFETFMSGFLGEWPIFNRGAFAGYVTDDGNFIIHRHYKVQFDAETVTVIESISGLFIDERVAGTLETQYIFNDGSKCDGAAQLTGLVI